MIDFVFDRVRGVTVKPETLLVPSFNALYLADQTEAKYIFHSQMTYIFLMHEMDKKKNPLSEIRAETRREKALEWSGIEVDWMESERFIEAEADFLRYNESLELKILFTIEEKIYQIDQLLKSTPPVLKITETSKGDQKIIDNSKQLQSFVTLTLQLAKSKEEFSKTVFVSKEQVAKERNRGAAKESWLEKRKIEEKSQNGK